MCLALRSTPEFRHRVEHVEFQSAHLEINNIQDFAGIAARELENAHFQVVGRYATTEFQQRHVG